MSIVFIAFGSNLGNRSENISKAISHLRNSADIDVDKVSPLVESDPVDSFGPKYLNGVLRIITNLSALDLLKKLQSIEDILGRKRTFKNASRLIDLDILLYDNKVIDEPELKIPHPKMFERSFVMKPLLDMDSQIVSAITNK